MSIDDEISPDALRMGMRVALGLDHYLPGERTPEVDLQLIAAGQAATDTVDVRGCAERLADDVITIGREPNRYTYVRATGNLQRLLGGVGYEFYIRRRFIEVVHYEDARVDELCVDPVEHREAEGLAAVVLADWPLWGRRIPRIPSVPASAHQEYATMIGSCVRLLRAKLGLPPFGVAA